MEVKKVASMLKYRGVRKEIREYLAKRYDTQYILSHLKQQDLDAKTKHYSNFAGDLVRRIKDGRETPDFAIQEEPNRRPYHTCPFVDVDKCEFCYWHDKDNAVCTA